VKVTLVAVLSAWLISAGSQVVLSQKTRKQRSAAQAVRVSAPTTSIIADTSVERLPAKYLGDNPGSVYQQLIALSWRFRKSQFETTPEYELRVSQLLNATKIGGKAVSDRFSFVHPYGRESYDADSEIFTLKPDTNYEIGLGYEVPEMPNDLRSRRDYSSIDLTRTSRTVGSRIGRTAIGIKKRITVRTYSALRLVMSNSNMNGWSNGVRFRLIPAAARGASGRVWLAVTGRFAPPYVLNDSEIDNATLDEPEEAHSFRFYLFFVPDSIVAYNITTGEIYGAWDLTEATNFDRPAERHSRQSTGDNSMSASAIRPPRILFKPEPAYTEEARKNVVTGSVVLTAVFSDTGEVTDIQVVKALTDGLTEN
jgi:hypothetical protein